MRPDPDTGAPKALAAPGTPDLPEAPAARQRLRASQSLLALGVYVVFAVIQHVEVMLDMIDATQSAWLTVFNLSGASLFYVLIRSGLNLRWKGDPSLTLPQILFGLSGMSWSYAITGPARGAVLLLVVLVLMFGVFALTPRQSRTVAAAGFAMLGSVMIWKAWTDPQLYDPRVEGLHLVFAAIVMAALAVLAERLGRLRGRLLAQRRELAQALHRIQSLATRDELTGLLNRRAAMDSLRAELRRRDRAQPALCIGLIDLDHFKRINDTHGHGAGDQVLRRFAEAAAQTVRAPDVMARWGGEEFLLVMPATDEADGEATLQRLRQRLAAMSFDDVAPGLRVTFSAGVAACRVEGGLERTIEQADRAMYEAKRSGRDRVLCASTVPSAVAAPASEPA